MSSGERKLARKSPKSVLHGSVLQARAAKALTEAVRSNRAVSTGKVLQEVGYSANMSLQPSRVTNSLGFRAELAKLGLTEELIVPALVQDIKDKPGKRAFELSIAGKWLGLDKLENNTQTVNIASALIVINPPR